MCPAEMLVRISSAERQWRAMEMRWACHAVKERAAQFVRDGSRRSA